MVNELANTTKDGETPMIEIALYEYGNSDLSVRNGYVKQIVPLTSDLDLISEELFKLNTDGGEEYCGYVLRNALKELNWSDNPNNLRMMVVAGNEAFSQGPISFREICEQSSEQGIIVNTIFCGDYNKGIHSFWKEGADLAKGQYLNINHNDKVVHVSTPFDDPIYNLNKKLNETYIGYGAEGEAKMYRQSMQDSNAAQYGKSNARVRASFKSKKAYKNTNWDLVDASEADESILEKDESILPDVLKSMTVKERKAYVEQLKNERSKIQMEITTLNQKAEDYIKEQQNNTAEKLTLDNVMINTLKKQATSKQFKFKE